MNRYFYHLSYDLKKGESNDYEILFEAIERFSYNTYHILESSWVVETNISAKEFCRQLRQFTKLKIDFFISEVTENNEFITQKTTKSQLEFKIIELELKTKQLIMKLEKKS